MLPANKHLLPVLGLDIHMILIPTPAGPIPTPIPHPFIGMTFDVMDYIPVIGSTVNINMQPRGISLTNGMLGTKKHIPMGGPFQMMPMIGHNSVNFFGSLKVKAQGSLLSPSGFMVMTCNDFGAPLTLSPPPGKKILPPIPSNYLPVSATIPIPGGLPVNVGGPYVPDLMGMLKGLVMSFAFGCVIKGLGFALNKLFKKFACTKGLSDKLCKMGFEPVDLVTGRVIYKITDFEMPGPMAVKWERSWYSDSGYEGLLGHGSHLCYDLTLMADYEDSLIGVILPDGRATSFPLLLNKDQNAYNRSEKLTLTNKGTYFELKDHGRRLIYDFYETEPRTYKPAKISNLQGFSFKLNFDRKGKLTDLTDCAGRRFVADYDERGRMSAVKVFHNGQEKKLVQYGYNENNDLSVITDTLEKSTVVRFENHLMVEKTDRNGQTFYWEYEGNGRDARCIHTWGEGGLAEGWISYHKGHNKVTNALGETSLYYFNDLNLCTKITDPLGNSIDYEYTDSMELYREIDEEANITGYSYDARGNLKSTHFPDNTSFTNVYDDNDLLKIKLDAQGQATVLNYNDSQLLKSLIRPDGGLTLYEYDERKQLASVTNENGDVTRFFYDKDFNLTRTVLPGGEFTEWFYDDWGRCVEFVNPERKGQHFKYDGLDRIVSLKQADNNLVRFKYDAYDDILVAEDEHHKIEFRYNGLGSLLTREDNGVRVWFNYDKENRLTGLRNEFNEAYKFVRNERGDIVNEIGFDGLSRLYQRDRAGKIIRTERPGGKWTIHEYDLAGRLIRNEHHDGSWETYSYDRNGRLVNAGNENGIVSFLLDPSGRVISETSGQHWVKNEFDRTGKRIRVTSSMGTVINQDFSGNGDLGKTDVSVNDKKVWETQRKYNALGLEIERTLPGDLRVSREYDTSGRQTRQRVSAGRRETLHRQYSWNVNDRLTRMVNELNHGVVNYGYDDFGSLAWAQYEKDEMDYRLPDAAGNLYKTKDRTDRKYGPGGRLLKAEGSTFGYDDEGYLIKKTTVNGNSWLFRWKTNGTLQEVTRPDGKIVQFEYDALRRRTAKIFNGKITRWLWNGNTPLHEWSYSAKEKQVAVVNEFGEISYDRPEPANNPVSWIFDGASFRPAAKITGEESYSIVTDYLGTPIEMYDKQGQKTWQAEYDIQGNIRNLELGSPGDCPFRYQGQYADEETGLYYNRFRYYSPEEGLYISQDPIRIQGGDKLYAYLKNPLGTIDPLGLEMVDPSTVNYSQAYVTGETEGYENAMRNNEWDWKKFPDDHPNSSALKVVDVDGQLVSFDNRRLLAAQNAGLKEIPVVKVNLDDIKPGTTITWGESLKRRLNSSPGPKYPKIQLPEQGTPNKPQVVPKCK